MIVKSLLVLAIIVVFIDTSYIDTSEAKPNVGDSQKKIRCFKPDRPQNMPEDVYEKYKISSKDLEEKDKKELWDRFVNWWKNMFAQIGKFFQKVGQFFKDLFSPKNKQKSNQTPRTEAPPTPDPRKLSKNKETLICVEYENDSKNGKTTKIYQIDVTTANPQDIHKLVTTVMTTTQQLVTTLGKDKVEVTTTYYEPNKEPNSTPFDPNGEHKDKVPVVIGVENKAQVKKEEHTDPTVVRAV